MTHIHSDQIIAMVLLWVLLTLGLCSACLLLGVRLGRKFERRRLEEEFGLSSLPFDDFLSTQPYRRPPLAIDRRRRSSSIKGGRPR